MFFFHNIVLSNSPGGYMLYQAAL